MSHTAHGRASLAVALADKGRVLYRLFPVAGDGSFDINFMHAFPNDWNDASQRVAGMWFLVRGGRAKLTNVQYGLHAMPARALRAPASLSSVPLLVDGKPTGTGPVFLARGRHLVASADRQVNIGLLTLEPTSSPLTRDFGLVWQRRSTTSLDVTAAGSASPFLLVFDEAYHPEWKATLDGEMLPHVIVNGVANGWIVPSLPDGGKILLTFTGQQYYVIAGAISVIALLIAVLLAWMPELWPIPPLDH